MKCFGDTRVQTSISAGLIWYRHHRKMYEIISDGSSRAGNWTYLDKISMRVFVSRENQEKRKA